MFKKPLTLEFFLYIIAIALGLYVRFLHLGTLSLSDYEAKFALESLAISDGTPKILGSNPAYTQLTSIIFFLFSGSTFGARLWPALAGCGLVLGVMFLRQRIGRIPALLLAFGLALDPGMNALSRLAGGPILAISTVLLACVFWLDRRPVPAGIMAGLALLSGPSAWFGIVSLLLTWGISRLIPRKFRLNDLNESEPESLDPTENQKTDIRRALPWGIGTLLIAGTFFGLSPQGLTSMVRSLIEFAAGWWSSTGIPLGRTFLALPAYEILPLIFGGIQLVRGFLKRDRVTIWLSIWLLVALLMVLLYQGRQVSDLLWAIVPLWILASRELSRYFNFAQINLQVVGGVITATFILLVLGYLTLTRINIYDPSSIEARLQWLFLGGILLVIAVGLIMVGSAWTVREANLGGAWGFLIPLILFTIGTMTGSAGLRDPRTFELWDPEPRLARPDILMKVINDISFFNAGKKASLPVTIIGVDSPALSWLFRDWETTEGEVLDPMATPEFLITPLAAELNLTADYRGAPFVWRENGDWDSADFKTWLNWYLYHQIPTQQDSIAIWVRADLMLDDSNIPTP